MLKIFLVWRGVSCAHGTAISHVIDAFYRCVPFARDTPCQSTAFVNVIYVYLNIYSSDSVEIKCTETEKCSGHTRHTRILWCFGIVTECRRVNRFDAICIKFEFQASVVHSYCHNCHFELRSIRTTLAWNSNWMQHVSKRLTLQHCVKEHIL